MVNNKYIGVFKTESEYDHRACLVLTYAIPLNKEQTEFDYDNSLIVDLQSVSQSVSDYLRDLSSSVDAIGHKSFMDFATTRKYQSRQEDVLTYLYNNQYIRKVPSSAVKLQFRDATRGDYAVSVSEINEMIRQQVTESAPKKEPWETALRDISSEAKPASPVEQLPLIESGYMPEQTTEVATLVPNMVQAVTTHNVPSEPKQDDMMKMLSQMHEQLQRVSEELAELRSRPKPGRKPKPKSDTDSVE